MKNISKKQFRILVTLSIVTATIYAVISLLGESLLPWPIREYNQMQAMAGFKASDWLFLVFACQFVIISVVAFVGLYRFSPWARSLTVAVWLIGLLGTPFSGPMVEPALAVAFYDCSSVLFGMIIALIYFSPVAFWFRTGTGAPQAPN